MAMLYEYTAAPVVDALNVPLLPITGLFSDVGVSGCLAYPKPLSSLRQMSLLMYGDTILLSRPYAVDNAADSSRTVNE